MQAMPIITLTSDWITDDYYSGAVRGKIFSLLPDAQVMDISNKIQRFNVSQTAMVLRNTYHHYPPGTVHIIAVNTEPLKGLGHLAIKHNGHFFLGADNGVFALLFDDSPEKIIQLNGVTPGSFAALDIYVPAACYLAAGKSMEDLGQPISEVYKQIPLLPVFDANSLTGSVIYIDSYGNAITNITRELFDKVCKGRPFEIFVQSNHYKIKTLNKQYNETTPGELLALFNSLNLLEVAIYNGNVVELLSLSMGASIRVKFSE